ncbi:MAG: transcriptional regulator, partial [Variovorax sp.]
DGDWGGRCTGALAVPVCGRGGRPLASLSVVYQRKSVGPCTLRDEFLPELRRGVSRIEDALRAH